MPVQVDVIHGVSDIDVHLSTPKQKVASNRNSTDNSNEIHVEKAKNTNCSKNIMTVCHVMSLSLPIVRDIPGGPQTTVKYG